MAFDDDANRVELASEGIPVLYAESYEIVLGILQQPASFCLTLGAGRDIPARDLAALWQPHTPFTLKIAGAAQFTGNSDGYELNKGEGGMRCSVRGRDALARLFGFFATSEKSFKDSSFLELLQAAMAEAYGPTAPEVLFSNEANRKAITGVPVKQTAPPSIQGIDPKVWASKPAQAKQLQVKMGEEWLSRFLKPEFDRAGLFLWAGANGSLILSAPNTSQASTFKIFRREGKTNIIDGNYRNELTGRYSRCDVHGRTGGGKASRAKVLGTYADAEMLALGCDRPLCISDSKCKTPEQAEFLARKKIVEARRNNWSLTYTIAGHTMPNLYDGAPGVPAPDIVVDVDDDDFGITGSFWVESVAHRRNPQRTTTMQLMRIDDVVFGGDPE